MNPITKQHRLSVARAWEGAQDVDDFRTNARRWAQTGLVVDSDSEGLERLAQLVADAEASCWVPVAVGLPDSDITVIARSHEGDETPVTLEFTDDSEGHGEPYWAATGGDLALCNYPHWRPLLSDPEQP